MFNSQSHLTWPVRNIWHSCHSHLLDPLSSFICQDTIFSWFTSYLVVYSSVSVAGSSPSPKALDVGGSKAYFSIHFYFLLTHSWWPLKFQVFKYNWHVDFFQIFISSLNLPPEFLTHISNCLPSIPTSMSVQDHKLKTELFFFLPKASSPHRLPTEVDGNSIF